MHPTISLIYIAMVKLHLLIHEAQKYLWFSQLAKGIFSELRCYGYELWVSVCVMHLSILCPTTPLPGHIGGTVGHLTSF